VSAALSHLLDLEVRELAEKARRSLVQIRNGHGGAGAGAVWHSEGLILTNAHVIGRRSKVVIANGDAHEAKVLAVDRERDLAALAVEATGLPTIELGSARRLRPGEWVLAVGHPWGLEGAVTSGVVIGVGDLPGLPTGDREMVAASLHLRPGDSGGVLVDAEGRLVGINTMMAGPNLGLAVSVDEAKRFAREALGKGA
jgi:S1-C subfamily serine protease